MGDAQNFDTFPYTDEQLDRLEKRVHDSNWFGGYDLTHRKLLATVRKLQKELQEARQ